MLSLVYCVILMGLVRILLEKCDQVVIEVGIEKCDSLFVFFDDVLVCQLWFFGDNFGIGDIVIVFFVYNLLNVGLKWMLCLNLECWY